MSNLFDRAGKKAAKKFAILEVSEGRTSGEYVFLVSLLGGRLETLRVRCRLTDSGEVSIYIFDDTSGGALTHKEEILVEKTAAKLFMKSLKTVNARRNPGMKLSTIVIQYLETALWSSIDENGRPLDKDYSISDFLLSAVKKAEKDLDAFCEQAGDLIEGISDKDIAHDFWLTRNHHGTGFWDKYEEPYASALTKLAHKFGECDVYITDTGRLAIS